MTLIVDASVAVKWGVPEAETERAMALVGDEPILGPDLAVAEIANALWRKETRGEIAPEQRLIALAACLSGYSELVPSRMLAERALELSSALKHPAYDCFYLALAEARDATLITADARLLNRVRDGGWAGKCKAL